MRKSLSGLADVSFRYPSQATSSAERASVIRTELLICLAEVERRTLDHLDAGCVSLREICFDWAETLLFELQVEQPANERGACLEGLSTVIER
jgi:hypothetical protein